MQTADIPPCCFRLPHAFARSRAQKRRIQNTPKRSNRVSFRDLVCGGIGSLKNYPCLGYNAPSCGLLGINARPTPFQAA